MQDLAEISTAAQRIILVTGPSGAGRTTATNALEDMGFEAIDNIPLKLVPRLFDGRPLDRPLALGIDVRNRDFNLGTLAETLETLSLEPAYEVLLLYLDCRTDVLLRRFSETRRRHPSAPDEAPAAGVAIEKELLAPLLPMADILIDTSDLSPRELRAALGHRFGQTASGGLTITVQSFSYKRGLPQDLDTVFDVRFLSNPHWRPELRPHDGRDPRVAEHVTADPAFADFYSRLTGLVETLLPAYAAEGKSHLSIGFGCTGGQHRSVTLAEKLANTLAEAGWRVSIRHRELDRRGRGTVPVEPG